jgi:hypothetical protein
MYQFLDDEEIIEYRLIGLNSTGSVFIVYAREVRRSCSVRRKNATSRGKRELTLRFTTSHKQRAGLMLDAIKLVARLSRASAVDLAAVIIMRIDLK